MEIFNIEELNPLLLMGIILFGGTLGGRLFQKIRIPQVVGYIIIGVILGVSGLNLITAETIKALQPFSSFALALIGFMIGGELKISLFRKFGKQFTWILLLEALSAFLVVSILTTLLLWFISRDFPSSLALGLLLGAISSATAPAATTDVIWETKSRGPVTSMVLGIVAMDDGVALILFALVSSFAGLLTGVAGGSIFHEMMKVLMEIGFSIFMGFFFGFVLSRLIRRYQEEEKVLAFSLGSILLMIGIARILEMDLILAAMSMGFFKTNFTPKSSKSTFKLVERFSPPIYILFFVLVGAKMDFRMITPFIALMAGVYFVGRTMGKFLGTQLGAIISKAPETVRKYLPLCLFSQAGVAIGLSIVAAERFPGELGDRVILIVTATTFLVQIIGPSAVKIALKKSNEVGLNITEKDLMLQTPLMELLPQSPRAFHDNTPASRVLEEFSRDESLYYPVVEAVNDKNKLMGVISVDSLKETLADRGISQWVLAHDLVEEVPWNCPAVTNLLEARSTMRKHQLDYIAVVDDNGDYRGLVEERFIQKYVSTKMLMMKRQSEGLT